MLRLQPALDAAVAPELEATPLGAPGMRVWLLRALQPGAVDLQIGLFPPGSDTQGEVVEYAVTVK